ncbi:MAG: hypothetical protein WBF13_10785 [Candidatus Zixiibacteriota bacterium]
MDRTAPKTVRSLIEVHSLMPCPEKKRRTVEARMKELGIDKIDYERYEEMFLRSREGGHFIILTDGRWSEVKHPWSKGQILRHLTGERTIGLFPAAYIDYLMLDIDNHDNQDEGSLQPRVKAIVGAIEGDPLIYQSSSSGGIRICFFLPEPVAREVLLRGCKDYFQQKNVVVKPGWIEVMTGRKGDRLPFGQGSYLVDPFTLEPIYHLTLTETILKSHDVFEHHLMVLPFDCQSQAQISVPDSQGDGVYSRIVTRLLEDGLYPEIDTNDALMKLSWDLIVRQGCPKPEAERFLVNWIQHKHNGLSNRTNSGRVDDIFAQIGRIVRRTDRNKARYSGSKYARREKRLSLSDVRKILALAENPKIWLVLFSLLEYCLNFRKEYSGRTGTGNKISNSYVSENPNVTYGPGFQGEFYCEIAKKTLQHLPGFDKANPQIMMREVLGLGVLSLKKEAHAQSHSCRHYWVHFRFNEEDPVKVVSLEEGLAKLRIMSNRGGISEKVDAVEGDKAEMS